MHQEGNADELYLPAIPSALNSKGTVGWGGAPEMASGYVPPAAPGEAQMKRVGRLVEGTGSHNVSMEQLGIAQVTTKLRVGINEVNEKKKQMKQRKESKCVVVKQNVFDPFA